MVLILTAVDKLIPEASHFSPAFSLVPGTQVLKKYLLSELIFLPLKNFIAHLAALRETAILGRYKEAGFPSCSFVWKNQSQRQPPALQLSLLPSSFLDDVHTYEK